eukprot:90227-Amphidinium_carterae.1
MGRVASLSAAGWVGISVDALAAVAGGREASVDPLAAVVPASRAFFAAGASMSGGVCTRANGMATS